MPEWYRRDEAARILCTRGYNITPIDLEDRPEWVRRAYQMTSIEARVAADRAVEKKEASG